MSSTRLSVFCGKALEIGWLLAVIITPLFFNVYSSRVFEPDKLTTLRTVTTIMAAIWVVRLIEERANGKRGITISWRTPLVLPALFTIVVYLLSTLFSVTPWVSFFGSYQRLQGTYTTLSYIVIFFIILQELRTRAQLDRLITVIVLNSLPIALYGFLQHSRLDPLPWGGDVTERIASNMGNPIFVAAYMIMAAFPTLARVVDSFRSILADEESGTADVLRAAAYIFIFLVQIIAIWFSHSRGPLMGLMAGLAVWGFLGLLTLQRAARQEQPFRPAEFLGDLGRGIGFGLGSLAMAGVAAVLFYFVGRGLTGRFPNAPRWTAVIGAVIAFFAIWLALIVNRRGWRWLWASALLLALLAAAGFLTINLVEPVRAWSTQQPWLGRLDDVLQSETGTGKVRSLIWEGALKLITPHAPLDYPPTQEHPNGRSDPFSALRLLVGYGPESMYVAYNRFYPPLLGHYESRTASPDRSHNETMDSLVITGLLGFAAYLWMFGSIFYFGLRWLGILPDGWRRTLFFVLLALGAVAAVAAVVPTLGPHFFCLAIPVGMVGGLFLYMIVYAVSVYWDPDAATPAHPYAIMLIGILAAVVAHLIEINFGIAIASTRTTFWAYAGAFAVMGALLVRERGDVWEQESRGAEEQGGSGAGEQRSKKRRKRRRAAASSAHVHPALPEWLGATLAIAIVGGFMLGTLAFDFVTIPNQGDPFFISNPEKLRDPLVIVWRAMTILPHRSAENCAATWNPQYSECRSYGVLLLIFVLTWVVGAVILISEMVKRGVFRERKDNRLLAALVYLFTSFTVGFLFALVLAGNHIATIASVSIRSLSDLRPMADRVTGNLVSYYGFILFVLIAGGAALLLGTGLPRSSAQPWGVIALVVLAVLVGMTIVKTNLRPIQADIVYKQAEQWERGGQWPAAIEIYQYAIELAPHEDFYYLYLGRALLEYARNIGDSAVRDNILQMTERTLIKARDLNPLNTDHSANLARMYRSWAEFTSDATRRQSLFQRSSDNYAIATLLSPNHAILWNEWATLHHYYLGDDEGFLRCIGRSLELDSEFDQTWLIRGDYYSDKGVWDEAAYSYGQAVTLVPESEPGHRGRGIANVQLGRYPEAIEDLEFSAPLLSDQFSRIDADLQRADPNDQVRIGQLQRDLAVTRSWLSNVLRSLARAYEALGDVQSEVGVLEQLVVVTPDAPEIWFSLGDLYVNQGRWAEAGGAYEKALELNPNHAQGWRVLGSVYAQLGRLDEAVVALQRALELDPQGSNAWDVHRVLAVVYNQLGQNDLALQHAQTALQLAPEDQQPAMQDLVRQLEAIAGGG